MTSRPDLIKQKQYVLTTQLRRISSFPHTAPNSPIGADPADICDRPYAKPPDYPLKSDASMKQIIHAPPIINLT